MYILYLRKATLKKKIKLPDVVLSFEARGGQHEGRLEALGHQLGGPRLLRGIQLTGFNPGLVAAEIWEVKRRDPEKIVCCRDNMEMVEHKE
ncbi:hypothetical protein L1987_52199 [Smallanthus sonchifolius]|uniref:Uncharacterized protein n=1 Tax=Smallanthus sonchifolius TaxID=185202 RepID=A0ACB9ESG0_9ASTR|nr:hypothetical protein L1987_52199 [Smallanthus sonchifolius]